MRLAVTLFAVWWLVFSGLTISIVRDSLRRQGRRLARADLVAIASGPAFWLSCLLEHARQARDATPVAPAQPVKPDYQPGDEVVLFQPYKQSEAA